MDEVIVPEGAESVIPQGDAPPPEPTGTPDAPPQGVPDAWDPKPWAYQYKGQSYYPKDKNHLLSLAEKGHAFAQRLGEVNRQWEDRFKPYQQYEELDNHFKTNPEFARAVQDLYKRHQAPQEHGDPQVQQVMSELAELKQWKQVEEERKADGEIEKAKTDLMSKYKDFDWTTTDDEGFNLMQRVIEHGLKNKIYNLHTAFKDLKWDEVQQKKEIDGRRQAAAGIQQAHKAGIVDAGKPSPKPQPKPFDPSKHSYDQLAQMAIKEFKQ